MNLQHIIRRFATAGLLLASSSYSSSSNFNVKPVRIEFSKAKMNSSVQVMNMEDATLTVQALALSWTTDGEKDIYTSVDDILLNPPVFEIPAHGTQYMRLGLRKLDGATVERAYRLILAEVPKPPEPGFTGLRTVVRISIPVFIKPDVACSAQLLWEARRNAEGVLILTAINRGTAHIQITHLTAVGDQHGEPVGEFLNDYLLPGQRHEWTINDPRLRGVLEVDLTAKTDGEDSHAHLLVAEP
jgi:fimbrial chaperone protein